MRPIKFLLRAVITFSIASFAVQPAFALTSDEKAATYTACRKKGTRPKTCCLLAGGKWGTDENGHNYCSLNDDRRGAPDVRKIVPGTTLTPSR